VSSVSEPAARGDRSRMRETRPFQTDRALPESDDLLPHGYSDLGQVVLYTLPAGGDLSVVLTGLAGIWRKRGKRARDEMRVHTDPAESIVLRLPRSRTTSEPTARYESYLAGAAVIGDEVAYIREWVAFHKVVGFDALYLYVNRTDVLEQTRAAIADFVDTGFVTLYPWPDFLETRHRPSYIKNYANAHILRLLRGKTRWVALFDADEFLFSPSHPTVSEALHDFEDCPAVAVFWKNYGSAGLKTKPQGLVIENYCEAAADTCALNSQFKSIVQPHRIVGVFNAHRHLTDIPGVVAFTELREPLGNWKYWHNRHVSNTFRLNHYYVKSDEEFAGRIDTGWAAKDPGVRDSKLSNRQQIEADTHWDPSILKHLDATRALVDHGPLSLDARAPRRNSA
jgi:Glycosyltransferase family 92